MSREAVLLLLLGSFLPNNILIWLFKSLRNKLFPKPIPASQLTPIQPKQSLVVKLTQDAKTQFYFNTIATVIFLIAIPLLPLFPKLYHHDTASLIIAEIAIVSTFATFYGNMSSAMASYRGNKSTQKLKEVDTELKYIRDDLETSQQMELENNVWR